MIFHIISIFPKSFTSYFETSIIWRAITAKKLTIHLYDLGDFSTQKTRRVDDNAYGMHGQVISPEPLSKAIEHVFQKTWKIPVIYMTPSWVVLTQKRVESFSKKLKECIVLCGHYEWIDQRIIDHYVDYEVSIWKYVLTSWELSSMVFLDSIVRHIPWVLWNEESLLEESFSQKLSRQKEYPVYTRPRVFLWKNVPDILVSGNHKEIEKWKKNNLK